MRYLLAFIVAAAASPLFAQQQLPDKFYLECYNGEYLVLVDRQKNIFSHKKPYFQERQTVETEDAIVAQKTIMAVQFNKWTGYFKDYSDEFKDCQILDPNSRQPLFK